MVVVMNTPARYRSLRQRLTDLDLKIIAMMANSHDSWPPLDQLATYLANYAPHLYALGFIGAWYALDPDDVESRSMIVRSVIAGGTAVLTARVVSQLVPRTRPFAVSDVSITGLIDHRPSHSFPSTHSAGATAFVVGLGSKPAGLSSIFRPLTLGVLGSRIYSGVHWPTDVGAGALVGAGIGYVVKADILRRRQHQLTELIIGLTPMLR
ncbi:phosphatase PAP2 family protein [Ferrimicrobium acidiphilum]|nr:phosphatase PAP2 family protein [Ferrimicrobium acidiphilum]